MAVPTSVQLNVAVACAVLVTNKFVGFGQVGGAQFPNMVSSYSTVKGVSVPGNFVNTISLFTSTTVTPIPSGKVPATLQNKSNGALLHIATEIPLALLIPPVPSVATTIPF